jgi:hypothetical protein
MYSICIASNLTEFKEMQELLWVEPCYRLSASLRNNMRLDIHSLHSEILQFSHLGDHQETDISLDAIMNRDAPRMGEVLSQLLHVEILELVPASTRNYVWSMRFRTAVRLVLDSFFFAKEIHKVT